MKYNPEEYEPVEERIKRFYTDHEDGSILTHLLSDPNNADMAIIRAEVFINGNIRASGMAIEIRDKELQKSKKGYDYESVNYSCWLENAETSAIGRALANLGYTGSKRPSREEMDKVERMNNPKPTHYGSKEERKPIIDEIAKIMESPSFDNEQRDIVRQAIRDSDFEGLKELRDEWSQKMGIF